MLFVFFAAVAAVPLRAQECPNCDCYQFPLPTACEKCCSVVSGTVESVTDKSITVNTGNAAKTQTQFVITPKTRKSSKIERDALVTVYYRRKGNVAERIDMIAALDGLITPANAGDPPVPSGCDEIPSDAFRVYLGDSSLGFSTGSEITVLSYQESPVLRIARVPKGIAVEAHFYEADGRPAAVIVDNQLYLNRDSLYSMKRPTRDVLVLYDQPDHPIFVIQYLNPHSVAVIGKFNLPGAMWPVIVAPNGITIGTDFFSGLCTEDNPQMFEVTPSGEIRFGGFGNKNDKRH